MSSSARRKSASARSRQPLELSSGAAISFLRMIVLHLPLCASGQEFAITPGRDSACNP
jgi:hypothetical protein